MRESGIMSDFVAMPTGEGQERSEIIARIVELVRGGQLVVVPTDTTYAVIADPFHGGAVALMRTAKHQAADISLPIAAATLQTIQGVAQIGGLALDLAKAMWPGQLSLLVAPQPSVQLKNLSSGTALMVRVPQHGFLQYVLAEIGPTAMTGANVVGQPTAVTAQQAQQQLGDTVALYVDGGTLEPVQSSVVDATGDNLRLVRSGVVTLASIREVVPMVVNATA